MAQYKGRLKSRADHTFFHSFVDNTKTHQEISSAIRQPSHAARRGPGALQFNREFQQPTYCRSRHSACPTLNAIIGQLHASPLY
jgi:hypothetical protein